MTSRVKVDDGDSSIGRFGRCQDRFVPAAPDHAKAA
jgi:hypothetical protein